MPWPRSCSPAGSRMAMRSAGRLVGSLALLLQGGAELARLTGWGAVVVRGFSHLDPAGRRLNVNRPTESVPGEAPRLETRTPAAQEVYEAYRAHVTTAAQGPL